MFTLGPFRGWRASLAAMAFRWIARLRSRRAGIVLVYHRVGGAGGDESFEILPAVSGTVFEQQLRHLRRKYRVVPASDILQAARARRRGERFPVAITFDDDLSCHAREAAPRLEQAGLTATFFLSGASLQRPFAFWWESLQAVVDRDWDEALALVGTASEPADIHELGLRVQSLPPADRDAVAQRLGETLGSNPTESGLRAGDVRALVESGFELGFHTRRHDFLPLLDDGALAAAMHEGRAELEELAGRPLDTFAYPHGDVDARVAQAARQAGYRYGFTTQPEVVRPDTDPLLIGRFEAPFGYLGRFALQLTRALWARRRRPSGRPGSPDTSPPARPGAGS
jgi:peptidoglycan/xylan/chitin deacetylase (PgdA/CDA1 family)